MPLISRKRRRDTLSSSQPSSNHHHPKDDDHIRIQARELIICMTQARPAGTVCPSEVARKLWKAEAAWRSGMGLVREVAAELVGEKNSKGGGGGYLVVTQRGKQVDVTTARGPVRLKWTNGTTNPTPNNQTAPIANSEKKKQEGEGIGRSP